MGTAPPLLTPSDPATRVLRLGFNIALEHRPDLIIDATSAADVVYAVDVARRARRPVAVMNTGHGPSAPADGAVLIRTARMHRVIVDPRRRVAWVEAGTALESVERCYRPADFERLRRIKPAVDPANTFRVNFNIPPERSPR
jgi:FAD/FMN-containing dehydrogenase